MRIESASSDRVDRRCFQKVQEMRKSCKYGKIQVGKLLLYYGEPMGRKRVEDSDLLFNTNIIFRYTNQYHARVTHLQSAFDCDV